MIGTTTIYNHTQTVLVCFTTPKQRFESFKLQQNKAVLSIVSNVWVKFFLYIFINFNYGVAMSNAEYFAKLITYIICWNCSTRSFFNFILINKEMVWIFNTFRAIIIRAIITVCNEVAKVMFLHLSVILFTGGVCLSACWDITPLRSRHPPPPGPGPPPEQTLPSLGPGTPRDQAPLPSRRLLLRTVRILLECILVKFLFDSSNIWCIVPVTVVKIMVWYVTDLLYTRRTFNLRIMCNKVTFTTII